MEEEEVGGAPTANTQAAPPPCPSPVGRGVITEIPQGFSELAVTDRRGVRGRTRKSPIKDESWKIKRIKQKTLASILAYEGIPFKSKSV